MKIAVGKVTPVIDYGVRKVCKNCYPNHPKGCPNWNIKSTCPPKAPSFYRVFDKNSPIIAIVNGYPLGKHMEKMKEKHPQWTDRQLRNPLYWQGTARKELKKIIKDALVVNPSSICIQCPEACGVLITETVAQLGIKLSWPPQDLAYQVAIAGIPSRGLRTKYPEFSREIHWGWKAEMLANSEVNLAIEEKIGLR